MTGGLTVASRMALHDLDKIVLRKTVIGILCPECGGDLQATGSVRKHSLWRRLWPLYKPLQMDYRCVGCYKAYRLSQRGSAV